MVKQNKYSKKESFWMFKAPPLLKQKMDLIARERVVRGKDKKTATYRRLGLAIARHDKFLQDIINADFREDNTNNGN